MLSHLKITVVVAQKMGRLGALSAGQPYTEGWASCFRDGRSPLFHRPPISLFKPSLSNPSLFFACLLSSCSPHLRRTTADHSQTRGNQRWANNSVFEYYSNTWGRILVFVFVFGWLFETEYYSYSYSGDFLKTNIIRIRIRVIFSNRILFVFVFGWFSQTE